MAMRAADVFNYPKQQNVIRSGTGSDDSCSTQSEGYSPPLPLYVQLQGSKTRCVSVAGRLQLRDKTTSACRRSGHNGPCPNENASNIRRLGAKEEEEE